jgi:hypothetical protein
VDPPARLSRSAPVRSGRGRRAQKLEEAAATCIHAQIELLFAAHEIRDGGVTVTELHTTSLGIPSMDALRVVGCARPNSTC